jgi:hypothetical protein
MNRILKGVAALALAGVISLAGLILADPVVPAGCVVLCYRGTTPTGNITNLVYWQGDYITFTNSIMYTDAAGLATQNLSGCSVTVTAGSSTTTNPVRTNGYVIVTNAGTWGVEFVVPAANPCYIEVSVSNVFTYTYPRYRIQTQARLGNP